MIHYLLLLSRQGKIRLSKWYSVALKEREKHKIQQQVSQLVLSRPKKNCNFIEFRDGKIVYRRYASLYFVCFTDATDNELLTLEIIHHFVEALDRYFGSVCELDVIFNFHKAYYLLDETLIAGELCEPSKTEIVRAVTAQDSLVEQINAGAAPPVPPSTSTSTSSSPSLDDAPRARAEHLRRNLQAAGLTY